MKWSLCNGDDLSSANLRMTWISVSMIGQGQNSSNEDVSEPEPF